MRFILLLGILLTAINTYSQQPVEGSLLLGGAYYGGDLNQKLIALDYLYPCYGATLRYNFKPGIAAKFQFLKGTIAGDDEKTPNKARGLHFKSPFFAIGIAGEIIPWRKYRFNNMGIFPKSFSPYASVGVSMIQSADEVQSRFPQAGQIIPEPEDKDFFLSLTFGLGARYDFHEKFTLGAEGIWYPTFSDYLDGVSKNGNADKKDWILSATFYISYFFGAAEPDFNFGKTRKF
ncbi:hypothetical protein MASR1M65_20520 [Saprospiraceae bacterium]